LEQKEAREARDAATKETAAAEGAAGTGVSTADTLPILSTDERIGKRHLTLHRIQKLEEIGFEWSLVLKKVPWDERYEQLVAYKAEHGNCRVPRAYAAIPRLGEWCHQQRCRQNGHSKYKVKLPADKVAKLQEIGFEFQVSAKKQKWGERFEALLEYRRANGHCNIFDNVDDKVVKGYVKGLADQYETDRVGDPSKASLSLVRWAAYQRGQYRRFLAGRHSVLTKARIKQLEDIGCVLACGRQQVCFCLFLLH